MTKAKPAETAQPAAKGPKNALDIVKTEDESEALAIARSVIAPGFRHGIAAAQLLKSHFVGSPNAPGLGDYADVYRERGGKAAKGDLDFASRMLAAQAITLDTIFAETARRMAFNMGESLPAMEIYARIALKAQANSRAPLEALAKLHQPREQTVRHVHVNEGGQAVIADQVHHHAAAPGGKAHAENDEQPQAPCDANACANANTSGAAGESPALPSPNAQGPAVPIPSDQGRETVPDARR